MLGNLRIDPFEHAEYKGTDYNRCFIEHMYAFAPAGAYVGQWLRSFGEFPLCRKPGSFNLDCAMEAVTKPHSGRN
jgi:arylsulfatase